MVLAVIKINELTVHRDAGTVTVPPAPSVAVPIDWVERLIPLAVTREEVLMGWNVDHADLACESTAYWATICLRVVTSDAADISITV